MKRLLWLVGLLTTPAHAQDDTRVQVTNTLVGEWNVENGDAIEDNDDYGFGLERLVLRGSAGSLDARLRVDGFGVVGEPNDDYQSDANLERLSVRLRVEDWTFEAGDHHVELGRGIVLSLRPIEGAGVDVSLRGGRVEYRGDLFEASLFGGETNTVNVDAVSDKYIDDVEDVVAGARLALRPEDLPEVAFFASHLQIEQDESKRLDARETVTVDPLVEDHTSSFGVSVDAPGLADWLAIYAEGDFQRRLLIGDAFHGYAAYGTIDLSFLDTQVLVEGLYLDDWVVAGSRNTALQRSFEYYRPPTMERIDQEVFNNRDVYGGRVRVERPLGTPDVVGYVNGLYRLESPGASNEQRVVHGYAGVEAYVPGRLAISGGYRVTDAIENAANAAADDPLGDAGPTTSLALQRPGDKTMIHGDLDYSQPLGESPYELHLVNITEYRTLESGGTNRYWRGDVLLSLDRARLGGITFNFGFDTENENARNFFYAGIVHWRVTNDLDLRATGGTQRGGIKCVGGVCREFPAFAGGRMELVARY